jgi:transaldolase
MKSFRTKIFADGADIRGMLDMAANPLIAGFTTNPTLMRKAGVTDYPAFAREIVRAIPDRPISFEVFADEFEEMERQASIIGSWGPNVYVKIPITNTRAEPCTELLRRLVGRGLCVNVTAMMTLEQVQSVAPILQNGPGAYVSVFAGRIADSGLDPCPLMRRTVEYLAAFPRVELIWASPRELLNLVQADAVGCHVITMSNDLIKKIPLLGKDLTAYSLETVKMFYDDAQKAGYRFAESQPKP